MIGPQQNSYWYLASPYSDPEAQVRQQRHDEAERALAWLLERRVWSYSPIVHLHLLAERHKMPTDAEFWEEYNHLMIGKAEGLISLRIEGWAESRGVAEELQFTTELGKPILHMLPTPDGFALA